MDDGALLLRAILEHPDEDTPRLMYADAIQDADPARAEFIRVQCELPKLWECRPRLSLYCECRYCHLKRREQELLAFDWCPVRPPRTSCRIRRDPTAVQLLDGNGLRASFEFVRGFIDSVTCTAADWLDHADAITAAHPVRKVALKGDLPDVLIFDRGLRIFHFYGREPHQFADLIDKQWTHYEVACRLMAAYWPKIEFELPT